MITRPGLAFALEIVDAVRRIGPDAVCGNLARHDESAVIRAAVTLAALVPDDRPVTELLAWYEGPETLGPARPLRRWDDRLLKPCGTHAAFIRHKNRGEHIDDRCREAERAYQRSRKRRERAA